MVSSKGRMWIGFRSRIPGIALLLIVAFVGLASAASAFASNTYYVSKSAGSDANAGTSKSAPWAHIPGMASCTGSTHCGTYSPAPGDTFILMGCDVWTNSDLPVLWNWSGSSGSPITIGGEDKTWYNTTNCPSAWNRPVWDAQKSSLPTLNSPFTASYTGNTSYVVLDSIEIKGVACSGACEGRQNLVGCYNSCPNWTFSNLYLHGWNIVTDGNCNVAQIGGAGTVFTQNIIDGSDATGASPAGATCYALYPVFPQFVSNNVIHDLANGLVGHADSSIGTATISGNLIYNIKESNSGSHPNALYTMPAGTYYVHDNVIHDSAGESYYFGYGGGVETDYAWNNIWYNIANSPEGGGSQSGASFHGWNNTVIPSPGHYCFNPTLQGGNDYASVVIENTHCITTGSVAPSTWGSATATLSNNVLMSPGTATSQGYTSSGTYAYSPTSATNGTVGAGTSLQGNCSGQLVSLCSDTSYTVIYNSATQTVTIPARKSNARPPSGAWDAGAFQYGSSAPAAPTNLQATVH
jgi:hypothetical protein